MFDLEKEINDINPRDIDVTMVKEYMRIDFDDPDNDRTIEIMLSAAKAFTQSYLGWKFNDHENVPSEINIAILSITEHWYKNRGILAENRTVQELPFVFTGILDLHRNHQVGFSGGVYNHDTIW